MANNSVLISEDTTVNLKVMRVLLSSTAVEGMQHSRRFVSELDTDFDKKEALVAAHQWAGAAGSIGYPEITRTARELEVALQQNGSGSSKRTRELLVRLTELFAEAVESD